MILRTLLASRFTAPALIGLIALGLLATYWPSLGSYLVFDDLAHIPPLYEILQDVTPRSLWQAVWSSNSGPTGRPLAMASFAVQVALPGGTPLQLKLVNLLIHLATGLALYRLALLLLAAANGGETRTTGSAQIVAMATALIWLFHPLNLTSVAYVIQRMNSLATLFTVLALVAYLRTRMGPQTTRAYVSGAATAGGLGLLGVLSKENAALLPLFIAVCELTVLRTAPKPWQAVMGPHLRALPAILAGMALIALTVFYVTEMAGGYAHRPFSLAERLLTEARVVSWYLGVLAVPDITQLSLYHDDWQVSSGLLAPPTTLISVILIGGLLTAGWLIRRQHTMVAFGILWFFTGHLLESTVIPLELVYEHRNYLPAFGPVLALTATAAALVNRLPGARIAACFVLLAVVATLAGLTHLRAERWADDPDARLAHLRSQQSSMRAQIEAAETYASMADRAETPERRQKHLAAADDHFSRAARIDPTLPDPLFGWIMFRAGNEAAGSPGELMPELQQRLSTGHLGNTAFNGMHVLTNCVVSGPCSGLSQRLPELFDAARKNPMAAGNGRRAQLLRDRARLQAHVRDDPDQALPLLQEAIGLVPDSIDIRLEYAYYAALTGNRAEALAQLDRAAQLDWLGRKGFTINRLRLATLRGFVKSSRLPDGTAPLH